MTSLKGLCSTRQPKFGHFIVEFATPGIGHLLKEAGCDFALFDTEHSGFGFETIKSAIRYFEAAQLPAIVRVPSKAYDQVARAADMGAEAVMVPMVDTAEEARDLVSYLKYTPAGRRGVALGIAHDCYRSAGSVGERLAAANERTCLFAQIETASGVENANAIAAVNGVDCLWVGHFDLSASLGIPGQFEHPRIPRRDRRKWRAPARRTARRSAVSYRIRQPASTIPPKASTSSAGQATSGRFRRRSDPASMPCAPESRPAGIPDAHHEGLSMPSFRVALSGDFRKARWLPGVSDVRP